MKNLFLWFLLIVYIGAAQAATLLPNGEQTFFDSNGRPLAGGLVYFYIPNTTTPKATYKDSGGTVQNTDPVALDAAGRAIIYGNGVYRQVVKDIHGNLIWDQLTSDGSASNSNYAGASTGTSNAQIINVSSFSAADGQTVFFRAGATNTGPMTLSINGTVYSLLKDTITGPVDLIGGEVVIGNMYEVIYDVLLGVLHLVNHPISSPFITITSNTTTDLGTANSNNIIVSGNNAISSFGASASINGAIYNVQFSGSPTLTYNSTSMKLPSAVDMKPQPGEIVQAFYLGSGNWQIQPSAPTGEVQFFNVAACPLGWTLANGSLGTVNMVGQFARGLDTAGIVDPGGRTLGSLEGQAVQALGVTGTVRNSDSGGPAFVGTTDGGTSGSGTGPNGTGTALWSGTVTGTGAETRPTNIALLACQKL